LTKYNYNKGNNPAHIKIKLQYLILNIKIMKTADKSAMTKKNFDELVPILSEEAILDLHAMSCVRGGEGDGGGDLIIIPKHPK
jgi:hypothetical protein